MFDLNPSSEPLVSAIPFAADASSPKRLRCVCGTCADCQSKSSAAETPTEFASLDSLPASASSAAPTKNTSPLHDDAGQEASNRPTGANHAANSSKPTGLVSPPSKGAQRSMTLEDVFLRTKRGDVHESRYAAQRTALRRFKDFAGDVRVLDISEACAWGFLRHMRSQRLSESAVSRQLLVLSSVVRRGQRAGLLSEMPSDPFKRVSSHFWPKRAHRTAAQTFSIDELQRLVARAAGAKRRAKQLDVSQSFGLWKLLLGLFTGIRLPELLSLRVSDVVSEAGCWGLLMRTKSRLRISTSGRRFVPLHRELLLCGFLEYVERRRDAGHTWLWFDSSLSERRQVAVSMALRARFARDVAACGLAGMGRGFSTLRRTFQDTCFRSGMSFESVEYLCGPSIAWFEGVNRHGKPSAHSLVHYMQAVDFDGLDLSGLYVAKPAS